MESHKLTLDEVFKGPRASMPPEQRAMVNGLLETFSETIRHSEQLTMIERMAYWRLLDSWATDRLMEIHDRLKEVEEQR